MRRARGSSPGRKSRARPWAWWAWVPSAFWWPTPPASWAWRSTAMTPTSRWSTPGGCPARCTSPPSLDEVYQKCDYITLHLPQTKDTKGMVNGESLQKMKDGVRILNFARGALVDTDALLEALGQGKVAAYATDFPADAMLGVEGVVALPHLGALHPGERGQLRCDGGGPDEGLPGKRQHLKRGEPALHLHGPGAWHPAHLRHPQECAQHHRHVRCHLRRRRHQH